MIGYFLSRVFDNESSIETIKFIEVSEPSSISITELLARVNEFSDFKNRLIGNVNHTYFLPDYRLKIVNFYTNEIQSFRIDIKTIQSLNLTPES